MTKLNLSVDEALSTTRSVRQRLDLSKPVPRSVIEECLELALQAPNGSNRSIWRWIVVQDPLLIRKVGGLYKEVMDEVPAMLIPLMRGRADGKSVPQQAGMWGSCLQAV